MAIVLINKITGEKVYLCGVYVNCVKTPRHFYSMNPIESKMGVYSFKYIWWQTDMKWYVYKLLSPWKATAVNNCYRPHYPLEITNTIIGSIDRPRLGSCLGLR